jgi:colanic acid biosynthesis protein WcaH
MLDDFIFRRVVNTAPLISIDILIKNKGKVLLGKRINSPAKGYFFSTGGRIYKNELISNAMIRIAKDELNIELKSELEFIGVFEHFYPDSIFDGISTHYVNLAYSLDVENLLDPPTIQHSEYKWFSIDELLESKQVHNYVKNYFKDRL